MELKVVFSEPQLEEICERAVNDLKSRGVLWVDKDLIHKLDELDFIRNINFYTNNCMAHDQLERFITELAHN